MRKENGLISKSIFLPCYNSEIPLAQSFAPTAQALLSLLSVLKKVIHEILKNDIYHHILPYQRQEVQYLCKCKSEILNL